MSVLTARFMPFFAKISCFAAWFIEDFVSPLLLIILGGSNLYRIFPNRRYNSCQRKIKHETGCI